MLANLARTIWRTILSSRQKVLEPTTYMVVRLPHLLACRPDLFSLHDPEAHSWRRLPVSRKICSYSFSVSKRNSCDGIRTKLRSLTAHNWVYDVQVHLSGLVCTLCTTYSTQYRLSTCKPLYVSAGLEHYTARMNTKSQQHMWSLTHMDLLINETNTIKARWMSGSSLSD